MLPCELPYGQYELIEMETCFGYVLDSEPVPFTVDGTQDVVVVEKHNMPQKGIIHITKTGEVFATVAEMDGADKDGAGIIFSVCDVTYVTEDKIKDFSIFNLFGTEYSYEDVESIEANFGTKTFTILEHKKKGQFSYTVHIEDKEYIFSVSSINEEIGRYVEHSYLELEEFDEALMKLGVRKISNDAGSEFCDLDSEYVERFLKIINNK